MSIYTDLACEARELDPDIEGVTEQNEKQGEISVTRTNILTEAAAKRLGKRMGRYVTLDAPELVYRTADLFEEVAETLCREIKMLISHIPEDASIVIVGLGNRFVTPDSLGPRTAERVFVTRHVRQYLPDAFDFPLPAVASIAPGVLGTTGVETYEMIKGIAERISPDVIIAVDSLASRRAARISTTVQLSDSGIDPGSGVGNIRAGLNRDTLGIPVIAIGVPLVVYASTIAHDALSMIASETGLEGSEDTLSSLAEKVVSEHMDGMIVTPKDVDTIIDDMSGIVAKGINKALFGGHYDAVRALVV